MSGAILIPSVYLHFALVFLNRHRAHRPLLIFCYLFSIVYLCLDFTPLFIRDVEPRYWFRWWPVPGTLYHPYQAFFILTVLYAHFLLFERANKERVYIVKKQYWIVALGTTIAYAGGSTNFFLWYNIPIPPVFNLLVSGYVAFIAYAILKYRLMDIRIVLTRTTIFVLLYGLIIGLPVLLVTGARQVLEGKFGGLWWVVPLAFYSIMTTVGPFLYLLLQRKAEDRLMKEQRHYQQTLLQASRGMTLIKDQARLLQLIVHMVTRTMKVTHSFIYLLADDGQTYECKADRGAGGRASWPSCDVKSPLMKLLAKNELPITAEEIRFKDDYGNDGPLGSGKTTVELLKAAVMVPSFVSHQMIGFLVLGEKRSKGAYTQDDLTTLSTLANQAALAIENCRFIKEVEQTQAQLFQTAKMLDLGTMASGIGHQMNNRLNMIRVAADMAVQVHLEKIRLAADYGKSEQIRPTCEMLEKSLVKIADNAARGGEIVKRLLDFSRLSEGFEPVSLSEALENCIRLWECKRDLTQIVFENQVSQILPPIHGNFAQVEEILFNLLDNAFDAIKLKEEAYQLGRLEKLKSEVRDTIRISAVPVSRREAVYLEVKVEDTGVGMSSETQKKLFVPFFTTKATSIKGTGLGLYVIKRMVEAHRGELKVESIYGMGSVFRVFFPVSQAAGKRMAA